MWAGANGLSTDVNVAMTQALEQTYIGRTRQAVDQFFIPETDGNWFSFNWAGTPTYLGGHCFSSPNLVVILLDGVQFLQTAANIVAGWYAVRWLNTGDPKNDQLETLATNTWAQFGPRIDLTCPNIYLVGHSAGGAVAEILGGRLYDAQQALPFVLTYGSPRPSGPSLQASARLRGAFVRQMLQGDPVPFLPLHLDEDPSQAFYLSINQIRAINNFVHPGEGWSLNDNNVALSSPLPTGTGRPPITDVAGWLLGMDLTPPITHSMYAYKWWWLDFAARPVRTGQEGSTGGGEDATANTHPAVVTAAERRAVQTVFNAAERQNAQPVQIPRPQEFVAVRSGRVWVVAWGEEVVAVGPTKRHARRMAREGNAWLRTMQTSAIVNPQNIVASMQDYIARATDPAGAFVPVMNTSFPAQNT